MKADNIFTFNHKDRRLIEKHYGRKDCKVLNLFLGIGDDILERTVETGKRERGSICFLGQMGRQENHQAAMKLVRIAKRVKKRVPEFQVYIVGNQPAQELKKEENDFIHVTGFVDDVDEYLERAQIAVFPLMQGAGIKMKVLRSMAMGTMVITTMVGAEGIDEAGRVIELAGTDKEFAEKIEKYLGDAEMAEERGRKSRDYIRAHFGWKASEEVLEEVYGREQV